MIKEVKTPDFPMPKVNPPLGGSVLNLYCDHEYTFLEKRSILFEGCLMIPRDVFYCKKCLDYKYI